jgi:putative aminopeptidase FrvX
MTFERSEVVSLLQQLSDAHGLPGHEGEIRRILREKLAEVASFEVDPSGNLVCRLEGSSQEPRVMIAAHMDEIGFMVRLVTEDGFIRFTTLGGWWNHVLLAQPVVIKTSMGDVAGVIGSKPVHFLGAEERKKLLETKEMFIDVGARSREEAEALGVCTGDPVVPATRFQTSSDGRTGIGKAFDDRAGCAVMTLAMLALSSEGHPNTVLGTGTVQEEVGLRGAQTAPWSTDPDVAIVLEGTPADDTPGFVKDESQTCLGKGPQLRLYDPTAIAHVPFTRLVRETAQAEGLPLQLAVRERGGTDAGRIHLYRQGVPSVVLSMPVRYAHSHIGMIDLGDVEAAYRLTASVVKRLDAATVADLVAGRR